MKKIIYLLIAAGAALSGCAQLSKSADDIAGYIDAYCATTAPEDRAVMRDAINSRTMLGDVQVTCIGDNE